jgi:hypothetical protein
MTRRHRALIGLLATAFAATGTLAHEPDGQARWLAGDHHIHSRFSVGWDKKTDPPTPILGADAAYPIPMNAIMARRFGLSWMVATDHGGPNHSKVSLEHAYPELLASRQAVPEVIQFFGMELNSPGADHSSVIVPHGADEARRLHDIEHMFDSKEAHPHDPARNDEARMIDALRHMDGLTHKPVVIANHPSRSATGLGEYGLDTPAELRGWNDAAPDVAIGMEGAPGHQAVAQSRPRFGASSQAAYIGDKRPRGFYRHFPTMGGFDQMTARLGGFWDSMLGEGRRWWVTATSDSHVHWSDGGGDFWPGEYSKTYVFAAKTHDAVLAGLRAGHVFVTTGGLISGLSVAATVPGRDGAANIGGALKLRKGRDVLVTIRVTEPQSANANGDRPNVARVDLIRGEITGPARRASSDRNPTTRVEARFTAGQWRREGDDLVMSHVIRNLKRDSYIRVRGTNGAEAEPLPDPDGEDPWQDLWFYGNPLFLEIS